MTKKKKKDGSSLSDERKKNKSEAADTVDVATQKEEEPSEIDELETLIAQVAEQKDKYLRLYSEFENFRRRTAKERLELISTANRDLMEALVPVSDDF